MYLTKMNTQSVKIIVDEEDYNVPLTSFDTLNSIYVYLSKLLKVPLETITLKNKESVLEVEDVKGLPFKTTKKISEISDIKNIKLEFETLKKIKTMRVKNAINTLFDKFQSENLAILYTFYIMFEQPKTADFINDPTDALFKKYFGNAYEFRELIYNGKFSSISTINEFIRKYNNKFVSMLENEKKENEGVEYLGAIAKEFEKRSKKIEENKNLLTSTVLTHTNIKVILSGMPDMVDIFDIFKNTVMSYDVPFVYLSGFYKIMKNFVCPREWVDFCIETSVEKKEDIIVLYVLNKYNYTKLTNKLNDYSKIIIKMEGNNIVLYIDSKVEDYNKNTDLKEEQLLLRICNGLNLQNMSSIDCKIYPQQVRCNFYMRNKSFQKLLYLDLLMNNSLVSKFLVGNERYRIFNKRGGVQTIYKLNNIVFQLQSLYVTLPLKKRIGGSIAVGDDSIEFKVMSAKNLLEVENLKSFLAFFFVLYEENKDCLEELYTNNVPSFIQESKSVETLLEGKMQEVEKKEQKLRDFAPEVFVLNYSRKCAKRPKIITEEEYEKIQKQNEKLKKKGGADDKNIIDIMKYPLYNEYNDVHYYSCQHLKDHPYPGLIKMDVNGQPHYAPCCFDVDQSKKETANRYIYENQEEIKGGEEEEEKSEVGNFKLVKTNKSLPLSRIGLLPKDILHFFRIIDPYGVYVRHFVPKGPKSLLASIAIANDVEVSDIPDYIEDLMMKMKNVIDKEVGFQNAFEYNKTTLKQLLTQKEKFLDIRIFCEILEAATGLRILFFSHNRTYPDGTFSSPDFAHNYLFNTSKQTRNHLILFETIGSLSEKLPYPHYEIITKFDKKRKQLNLLYDEDEAIVSSCDDLFLSMYTPYGSLTRNVITEVPFTTKIVKQHVDFLGKTRVLYFENGINILTTPIDSVPFSQIHKSKEYSSTQLKSIVYQPCDFEKAIEFLQQEKCVYRKVKVRNYLVGLASSKGQVNFYIPLKPTKEQEENKRIEPLRSISMIRESQLEKYIMFEQIARRLSAHVCYLFSKFINQDNKKITAENMLDRIEEFNKNYVYVDDTENPLVIYKDIPRKFQSSDLLFMRNNKIIATSKDLERRMMYYLLIFCKQGFDKVREFQNNIYIPNYYQNVRDFGDYVYQNDYIMFSNQSALLNWIAMETEKSHMVHSFFTEEFMSDLQQDFALITSDFINNSESNQTKEEILPKAVYICKIIKEEDTIKGKVIMFNPEEIIVQGKGHNVYLTFKYDEQDYICLLTKFQK